MQAVEWVIKTSEYIIDEKQYLTELDQAIGDGDHGINMARGFEEVVNKMAVSEYSSVAAVMKDTAMTLMSKIGGASGPLYGTAFLRLSVAWENVDSVNEDLLLQGLQEALQGLKDRGKAEAGEKTLVDVWQSVVDELQEDEHMVPTRLKAVAEKAMQQTKDIEATKGRAAYLKERSIGHIDPGAMSSFYLFSALANVLEEIE